MKSPASPLDASLPHAAAGFFYCPKTGRVLLHQRDGETLINPHKWAFFTGLADSGEEVRDAFIREIREEIGYTLQSSEVVPLETYLNETRQTMRHVYVVSVEEELYPEQVYEGAGVAWHTPEEVWKLDLTDLSERDLKKFFAESNEQPKK